MSIYLVLVLLTMPASQGQPGATIELHREFITASSDSVCQAHADKHAEEQRQRYAGNVRRLNASVAGSCAKQLGQT